jgi:hypothetical protein
MQFGMAGRQQAFRELCMLLAVPFPLQHSYAAPGAAQLEACLTGCDWQCSQS